MFAEAFSGTNPAYDLDDSGWVDFGDFFVFADNFGRKDEVAKLIAMAEEMIGLPDRTALAPNYPNPFNASTTIRFMVSEPAVGILAVYDLTGHMVKQLYRGRMQVGRHEFTRDGTDQSDRQTGSGVYIVRLRAGSTVDSQKITLVK